MNISRSDRIASAASVFLEADAMDCRDKDNLLGAMWKGWRYVMTIKLAASLSCDRTAQQRNPSRLTAPGEGT